MICLFLTTNYIPLPQGFESRWRHACKKCRVVKKNINDYPCECISGLTILLSCGGFTEYFPGSQELPWLSSTSRQSCKCVFRSRIAWFDVDSVSMLHIEVRLPVLLCAVKTVEDDFRFCWTTTPNVGQTHKENPNLVRILYMVCTLNDIYKQYNKLHEH